MAWGGAHRKLRAAVHSISTKVRKPRTPKAPKARKTPLRATKGQSIQHAAHTATGHHKAEGMRAHPGSRKTARGHFGSHIHGPRVKHERAGNRTGKKNKIYRNL
ncbi:hypothetical protein [Nocardia jiangxiensis]|uniref:hypothetical protein n=1 Tax=Nocardia jiangxiensis TaxID=282685 RepID=UPI00031D3AA6|nr:hypothetical protein [Nocardia jiangxiensis]